MRTTAIEQQCRAFQRELAARLNAARRGTGADLAREVGYTQQMVSNVKTGLRLPTLEHAVGIAWYWGDTLDAFMRAAMTRAKFRDRRERQPWPNGLRRSLAHLRQVYDCRDKAAKVHAEEILRTLARCVTDDKQAA